MPANQRQATIADVSTIHRDATPDGVTPSRNSVLDITHENEGDKSVVSYKDKILNRF